LSLTGILDEGGGRNEPCNEQTVINTNDKEVARKRLESVCGFRSYSKRCTIIYAVGYAEKGNTRQLVETREEERLFVISTDEMVKKRILQKKTFCFVEIQHILKKYSLNMFKEFCSSIGS
jgi:hypothetical protein